MGLGNSRRLWSIILISIGILATFYWVFALRIIDEVYWTELSIHSKKTCAYILAENLDWDSAHWAQDVAIALPYPVSLAVGRKAFIWGPPFLPEYSPCQMDLPKFGKLSRYGGLSRNLYPLSRALYCAYRISDCELVWVFDQQVKWTSVDVLLEFLQDFDQSPVDFLSTEILEIPEVRWNSKHFSDPPYFRTRSHIFRFTRPLLQYMFEWSRKTNYRFEDFHYFFPNVVHRSNYTMGTFDHPLLYELGNEPVNRPAITQNISLPDFTSKTAF